jgi:hypothetical protein
MKYSYKPVDRGFRVHLMSPLGRYPAEGFLTPAASLIVNPDICFSIVRIPKEDWSFSEVKILNRLEIPLFGSILLAGEAGTPHLFPYPSGFSLTLETETLEEIGGKQIEECRSHLLERIELHLKDFPATAFHRPPCLAGAAYNFVPNSGSHGDRLKVLHNLETANPVLLRGVSCLLKGRMAFQHSEFGEAACIYLWIAMDAAHSLVLERLRKSGMVNPSSKDAAKYFEKLAGYETEWEKFFEDDYENRIRAIHPANRFGAEAIPQYLADDFLELYDSLIPLFEFFVTEFPNDFPPEDAGN